MFRGLQVKSKKDHKKRDFYELFEKRNISRDVNRLAVDHKTKRFSQSEIPPPPPPPPPPHTSQQQEERPRSFSKLVDSQRANSKGYLELNPDYNKDRNKRVNVDYSIGDGGRSWRSRIQQRERERESGIEHVEDGGKRNRKKSFPKPRENTFRRDFSVLSRSKMKKPQERDSVSRTGKKRKRFGYQTQDNDNKDDDHQNNGRSAPKKQNLGSHHPSFDPLFLQAVQAQMSGNSRKFDHLSRKFDEKTKREENRKKRKFEVDKEKESEYDYNRGFQQYVVSHRNYTDDPTVGTGEDHDFVSRGGGRGRGRGRGRGNQNSSGRKRKLGSVTERCRMCYNSKPFRKNLVVSLGNHSWFGLPPFGSLVEGHCVAVPLDHKYLMMSGVEKGSPVYQEMIKFQHSVSEMFRGMGKRCLFLETVTPRHIRERMHCCIEIIPIPEHIFPTSRTYFQKAIQESTSTSSFSLTSSTYVDGADVTTQRKIVEVRAGGISKSVPSGMPYFYVGFEWEGGIAYVIDEGEGSFPFQFGKDVISGMLGLDKMEVRDRRKAGVSNDDVLKFVSMYKKYDWTESLD